MECRYEDGERRDEGIYGKIVSMKEDFDEKALSEEESAALFDGFK